ncbi:hypothetical protein Strvi_4596 [Streptomyces violaceusniger Tu 4113]|uniref:Uncharacterized protein n=1 Tax=Streptomyces violaceusniger (strain Tu 4113) TaxID=653045 RepID=G2P517_STRV4|nr:hypothetical protein Strvi_4596 [Streptomyces violaceusniger Tu 4113]
MAPTPPPHRGPTPAPPRGPATPPTPAPRDHHAGKPAPRRRPGGTTPATPHHDHHRTTITAARRPPCRWCGTRPTAKMPRPPPATSVPAPRSARTTPWSKARCGRVRQRGRDHSPGRPDPCPSLDADSQGSARAPSEATPAGQTQARAPGRAPTWAQARARARAPGRTPRRAETTTCSAWRQGLPGRLPRARAGRRLGQHRRPGHHELLDDMVDGLLRARRPPTARGPAAAADHRSRPPCATPRGRCASTAAEGTPVWTGSSPRRWPTAPWCPPAACTTRTRTRVGGPTCCSTPPSRSTRGSTSPPPHAISADLRQLTAHDQPVRDTVMGTPGRAAGPRHDRPAGPGPPSRPESGRHPTSMRRHGSEGMSQNAMCPPGVRTRSARTLPTPEVPT